MSQIVVQSFVTLDGVMQAPGARDEDPEGGFPFGGWQFEYEVDNSIIGEWESRTEALLLGRKTYDIWAGAWGVWDEDAEGFMGELTRRYNRVPKYVASRTRTSLEWKNATLLGPDLAAEVAAIKASGVPDDGEIRDGEIRVWGSSELIRTLAEHDLIDEYRLVVYPVVLGTGKKLFPEGFPHTKLERTSSDDLGSGVRVEVFRPARTS